MQRIREAQIAKLLVKGFTAQQIAEKLGVAATTVSSHIAQIRRHWAPQTELAVQQVKEEHLAKVRHLEQEYWKAWEESCKGPLVDTQDLVPGDDGMPVSKKKHKYIPGNSRYLKGVQWCLQHAAKIQGILDENIIQTNIAIISKSKSAFDERVQKYIEVFRKEDALPAPSPSESTAMIPAPVEEEKQT